MNNINLPNKKLAFKFMQSASVRLVVTLLSLVLTFYLSKHYGLEFLGYFTLSLSIIVGAALLSRFGFEKVVLKHSGSVDRLDALFYQSLKNILKASLVLGGISTIVVILISKQVAPLSELTLYLTVLSLTIPFVNFNIILGNYFIGIKKPYISPLFEPSGYLAVLALYVVSFNYISNIPMEAYTIVKLLALIIITISFISGIYIWRKAKFKNIKKISIFYTLKNIRHENFDFFLSGLSGYLISMGVYPILGVFLTSTEVGVYRICERICSSLNFLLVIINSVVAPQYAKAWKNSEYNSLFITYKISIAFAAILSIPIFLILIYFSDNILIFSVLGDNIEIAKKIIIFMLVGALINTTAGGSILILNLSDNQRRARNISLFMIVFGVIIFSSGALLLGLIGAALAYLIYNIAFNLLGVLSVYALVFNKYKKRQTDQ